VTAAVGWAVVGPDGVEQSTCAASKEMCLHFADALDLCDADFRLIHGYRLARVRIEVIEESDDE
jgi:hypothetical protein